MKINPEITEIAPGVRAVFVDGCDFKTSMVTVSLIVPRGKNLGELLVLPKYLAYSSKEYPDPTDLNAKLEYLYGALLDASTLRVGENTLIELGITCIDSKYCFGGEDVGAQSLELLLDLLFEPNVVDGKFDESSYELQKRLVTETVESEVNRKRSYALTRMLETMCADEVFGITRQEKLEAIENSTALTAYNAWRELLKEAYIQINLIGSFDRVNTTELMKSRFAGREDPNFTNGTVFVEYADDVTLLTEKMNINQSKLVLGYRSGMTDRNDDIYAEQMMVDILGGGPYSRLFRNVREKLSLCYYCSASLMREKGIIVIQSGIENENRQKVLDEVARQLEIMKHGEFTDEEFEASKTAICDSLNGAFDSPDTIDVFLSRKIFDSEITPIEKTVECYRALTREDIVRAANRISLDTVYTLEGKGESGNE